MQEPHPSQDFVSDGAGHRFCYVYWEHGANSVAYVYYLDIPLNLEAEKPFARRRLHPKEDIREFVTLMRQNGWQQYMSEADQESYRAFLLRTPDLEAQFEHCVIVGEIWKDDSRPSKLKGLYRLGGANEYMIPTSMWDASYEDLLKYLEDKHWEVTHTEEYSSSKNFPQNQLQLRFYKRPLA